jgi:hypothetical protein
MPLRPIMVMRPAPMDYNSLQAQLFQQEAIQNWTSKKVPVPVPTFILCRTHEPYSCRCRERNILSLCLEARASGIRIMSKKKLRTWIIVEYSVEGWKDNFKIIELVKKYGLELYGSKL